MMQRVAVCCNVLQRVAACCSVLQRVQRVAVCSACCSVLQFVANRIFPRQKKPVFYKGALNAGGEPLRGGDMHAPPRKG